MCPDSADLWHHLEDVHSIPKPGTGKRQRCSLERTPEDAAEGSSAAKKYQTALPTVGLVSNYDPDVPGRLGLTNALPNDFCQTPPDMSPIESGDTTGSVTPLSSLFGPGLKVTFSHQSSSSTPSSFTDSYTTYEVDSFSKTSGQPRSEDIPDITQLAALMQRIKPTELIDPELRDDASPPVDVFADELMSGQGQACMPTAIDCEENIWEVEELLARWKKRRRVVYLVKWKGFSDTDNTWVKQSDISKKLVGKFDETYLQYGGNHFGVELLRKKIRQGRSEYLVRWKGRPKSEDSWENASTISHERVKEVEASIRN